MSDDESTQQEAGDDEFNHLLGVFELPDAQKMIPALEADDIAFAFEQVDDSAHTRARGSYGRMARLRIWIREADQAVCEAIQARTLNIQV